MNYIVYNTAGKIVALTLLYGDAMKVAAEWQGYATDLGGSSW